MAYSFRSVSRILVIVLLLVAAPVRAGDFIPIRKQMPIPGKIIAILVSDPAPVLGSEGRSGPPGKLCLGWNGGSYSWIYIPVAEKGSLTQFKIALPDGKSKVYPHLSIATSANTQLWGIDARYALVEVEVNDRFGSPSNESVVATRVKKLDQSSAYPINVEKVIDQLKRQYESHLAQKSKDLDAAMNASSEKVFKKHRDPKEVERANLMFVTWMPLVEKLVVRFQTTITDGDYSYGFGMARAGDEHKEKDPHAGMRYGTQFGIKYRAQFEVSKSGNIGNMETLPIESFGGQMPRPM